jgi:hypothetical protein
VHGLIELAEEMNATDVVCGQHRDERTPSTTGRWDNPQTELPRS